MNTDPLVNLYSIGFEKSKSDEVRDENDFHHMCAH
jgi:hypothetical protein